MHTSNKESSVANKHCFSRHFDNKNLLYKRNVCQRFGYVLSTNCALTLSVDLFMILYRFPVLLSTVPAPLHYS